MLVLLYTLFFARNLGKIASNLLLVVVVAAVNRPVITGLVPMMRYVYKRERAGKLRYEDSRSIRNEEIFPFLSG